MTEIGILLALIYVVFSCIVAKYFKKHPSNVLAAKIVFAIHCIFFLILIVVCGGIY